MGANSRLKCSTPGCERLASPGSRTGECNECRLRTCKLCGIKYKPTAVSKPDVCSTCNQNHRVRTRFTESTMLDVFRGDESGKSQPGSFGGSNDA